MPLIAEEPPIVRPRGNRVTTPAGPCGTVMSPQPAAVVCSGGHFDGSAVAGGTSPLPASINNTLTSASADSRAASTHPAVPAPTTTMSYVSMCTSALAQ
jgi:hypothetical protein